jgi:osmotically-inducible protein OsmY
MKNLNTWAVCAVALLAASLAGCSNTAKTANVSSEIRRSLDNAGLKTVSVSQDRDKGVVTLGGHVATDDANRQAQSIAQSIAAGQVVADEIAVVPAGDDGRAKSVNADLDKGIEQNLDAVLLQNKLHDNVKYSVKNHVVTLTGEVNSQMMRHEAEVVAASVPNVQQVVNELQVRNQRATSSQ